MDVFLTVRRLKEGSYDDWRQAWDPGTEEEWPKGFSKAYIVRNRNDPNEVIAFGFFDGDSTTLAADPAMREQQQAREQAMAPFIDEIGADGVYEVVETVKPPGT